ncbi:MAG: hypothetical protein PHI31_00295 [Desulfuromonadaceae bacterium]|nr:hypothetical protein [Desulfuromonadaceae bacterium]
MPITQIKNDTATEVPQRIPLDATKTSFSGNAFNISIMLENNQPINPTIRMTAHTLLTIV